jgi:protein-arginine kinase activator protein McsA
MDCETCGEEKAEFKITVSKVTGEVVDNVFLCRDCTEDGEFDFALGGN